MDLPPSAQHHRRLDQFFRLRYLFVAILLALCLGCIDIAPESGLLLTPGTRTLTASAPLEAAVRQDGATVINDSAATIMCIDPAGTLRYLVKSGKEQVLTGMALDADDNLYLWVSDQKPYGIVRDSICQFGADGRYVRTLYSIEYEKQDTVPEHTTRTSPLRVEGDTLCFVRYDAYATQLYAIDLPTGQSRLLSTLGSDTPFLYNDVEAHPDGSYCYAKITGELGTATPDGVETPLYQGSYTIADDSGFRPFYIRSAAGALYTYDYWDAALYQVKDGALSRPDWQGEVAFEKDVSELNSSGGTVVGISDGQPWATENGTVTALPDSASLSVARTAGFLVLRLLHGCAIPGLALAGTYLLAFVVWRILIRGKKVAWKLLTYEIFFSLVLFALLYVGIASKYGNYIQQSANNLEQLALLTADVLPGADVSAIEGSGDMGSASYQQLSQTIIEHYRLYESETDTAAALLLPCGENGSYCIAASNRGYGDIMGTIQSTPLTELLSGTHDPSGSVYLKDEKRVYAYAAVRGEDGGTAGYFCLYTTSENVRYGFASLWSPLMLTGYFLFLCLFLFISMRLLTRRLEHITRGIERISNGDFALRLPQNTEDELGELIECVNRLSDNIQTLIDDKVELTEQVRRGQYEVLWTLASIVENKSGQTGAHVARVSQCVRVLASRLDYTGVQLEYVALASTLHDVGKLFVPAEILEKPGKLTPQEFEVVKRHVTNGEALLRGAPGPIMEYARRIALEHHERWDGGGYMLGKKGADISLEARITAVADVYDALMSRRPYKDPFPPQQVYEIIVSEGGKQFDPAVVAAFRDCFAELCRIVENNPDPEICSPK